MYLFVTIVTKSHLVVLFYCYNLSVMKKAVYLNQQTIKQNKMKTSELNEMSLSELRELSGRISNMIKLKSQIQGAINLDAISLKMRVQYIGIMDKLKQDTFIVEKINKVNVVCKSETTGQMWNIKPWNIREFKYS